MARGPLVPPPLSARRARLIFRCPCRSQEQNDWCKLAKAALDYLAENRTSVSSFAPLPSFKRLATIKVCVCDAEAKHARKLCVIAFSQA